jgi:methyl-accepting chemotaxis protein
MINEEVRRRLEFMDVTDRDRQTVAELQPILDRVLDGALDKFYGVAKRTSETARFFDDDAHMSRAKGKQHQHWMRIANGRFDEEFYSSVRRIGTVHAKIGLDPRWYIGAYGLVLDGLIKGIAKEFSPLKRLLRLFRGPSAAEASAAIVKAALIDMDLSISIYFEIQDAERQKVIGELNDALERLARGDLTSTLKDMPPAFVGLETSFNDSVVALRDLIGQVSERAASLRTGSEEISQAADDLARRTEANAASLEETSAALVQIDSRLKQAAQYSNTTLARADQAMSTVGTGRGSADSAVQAMSRVNDSAKGIDSVIEGLDKIAFQTRVLAMNAAVEAGRAGEAGRGFAVVADLVSALAMRAEEEAKRARDQLTVTQDQIVGAVDAVKMVDDSLVAIATDVEEVHKLLGTMTEDNRVQSLAVSEITTAISAMDQATQQNAAMVEQTSAAARTMTSEVQGLADSAARFSVGNERPAASTFQIPTQRSAVQARPAGKPKSPASLPTIAAAASKTRAAAADGAGWRDF